MLKDCLLVFFTFSSLTACSTIQLEVCEAYGLTSEDLRK
jgi:hypothetical protein